MPTKRGREGGGGRGIGGGGGGQTITIHKVRFG